MTTALAASIALAVMSGLLAPFGQRLNATTLWAGKALMPPETADAMPRGMQSAISGGWPGNVVFVISLLPVAALVAGFLHAWWMAPAAFLLAITIRVVTEPFNPAPRTVDWYLTLLHGHAIARRADYRKKNDSERADAAAQLAEQLEHLLSLYVGSGIPAPDALFANSCAHGDPKSLITNMEKRA